MWKELGISSGTGIIILVVSYFIIKWAVKNGVKEAYKDITGKKTFSEEEFSKAMSFNKVENDEDNDETEN